MYTVFYNCETTPIRLAEWINDMAKEGKELVAVSGQLFYFKSAVELSCKIACSQPVLNTLVEVQR